MPRRKRTAAEFIDLTGDSPEPVRKRPAVSSSQTSRAAPRLNYASQRGQSFAYPAATQEPDYLDLTQDDDTADKEFYGTFGSFLPARQLFVSGMLIFLYIDGKIVGVRYYDGYASPGEAVLCRREPENRVCTKHNSWLGIIK